jgi:anti-sigma regulatory factor (Ser/Thr protein kinase)
MRNLLEPIGAGPGELRGYLRDMEGSGPPAPRSWSRTLRAGPTTVAEARWFLREALSDQDASVNMDDAALLATEVASNAIRYGKEPIEMSISLYGEGLRVSVFDRGPGFDPQDEAIRTGGWGVNLIERLSSDWGVDRTDEGTEVWFRL